MKVPCSNPDKAHLWRLPDFPEPFPHYEVRGNIILIWPLYGIGKIGFDALLHHGVRSAVWSRSTFLRYTDAISQGVELKFYVESSALDVIAPIFEACRVDISREVLTFDGTPFHAENISGLGKSLAMFTDSQFAEYDWVGTPDFDIFCSVAKAQSVQYPFFAKLQLLALEMVALSDCLEEYPIQEATWWHERIGGYDAWCRHAGTVVDATLLQAYQDMPTVPRMHGAFPLFPAKRFHLEIPERLEWIAQAGKVLQDDEAVFSLYRMQWPVLILDEALEIPFVTDSGEMPLLISRSQAIERSHGFYINHMGSMLTEPVWQWDSGLPITGGITTKLLEKQLWW